MPRDESASYSTSISLDRGHADRPVFFAGIVIAQVVLYLAATLILRRRSRNSSITQAAARRALLLRLLRRVAVVFACIPAATFLANLLPGGGPTIQAWPLPLQASCLLSRWPWSPTSAPGSTRFWATGAVGAMTMFVLGADVVTGSHLMLSSLMGLQPVVAGRFYGFGNPAFSIFATGALLLAIALADVLVHHGHRALAAGAVGAIGIAATIVDGTPGWGSDFGGPPAIIPGFVVLVLLVLGVRISVRRAASITVGTVIVIASIALLDWLRGPEDWTHLAASSRP